MPKKIGIVIGSFYLIGVFGFALAFGLKNWSEGWGIGEMALDAVGAGIAWPYLALQSLFGV
jgi:hypothetical protein